MSVSLQEFTVDTRDTLRRSLDRLRDRIGYKTKKNNFSRDYTDRLYRIYDSLSTVRFIVSNRANEPGSPGPLKISNTSVSLGMGENDAHFSFFTKKERRIRVVEKESNGVIRKVKEKYTKTRTLTVASPIIKTSIIKIEEILELLLEFPHMEKYMSKSVHSYTKGKSYITCAKEHIEYGKEKYVLMVDIKGFFHSITKKMIYNAVKDITSSALLEKVSTYDGCVYPQTKTSRKAIVDNLPYIVASLSSVTNPEDREKGPVLPMGVETAGIISNLVLREADAVLSSYFKRKGMKYTRYSDNIIVSSRTVITEKEVEYIRSVIEDRDYCGETKPFKLNKDKTTIKAPNKRQRVLGIIINEKPNITREKEMWLRSRLMHLHKKCTEFYDSIPSNLESSNDLDSNTLKQINRTKKVIEKEMRNARGNLSFIKAVNPQKYEKYASWLYASTMTMKSVDEKLKEGRYAIS